ncbi:PREDICTED: uncharacterized protein LOC104592559 [Nelumbo nucifera]|uniref:Uncharacterized protein LOC104592559 n=2 Tax=Nelumbo nucifera TaxID=4432 RepID=A0A1U7ZQ83_NELNU|nr:PREDICTED: uncharacterized protein LOC104592559 [Nelumbo nucifera]XP_010250294.1 PREDICTED: uncharacterized protein LOC104592559 [Nelumbo nucifera]XP_010250295.1 PREDICTED: uncharacterized protein LOC104592559 [Nelumbo nucifera]XP_010250296.1 PREDICTED: uncharacterized protein LOC104592559 [Nelumbo nucifera]XP_019052446.1 PREDICTED: uncharacterized protein LOC104592559 [Nelumbo nucifera]XP_019052447.1 PREDICTED: uncharacterized protein LOC104592559 [Nelumbo nucifera]DAD45074.1 TPA_asm: hyp
MGKSGGKKKKGSKSGEPSESADEKDTAVSIAMAEELKDEGNRLFQKRDHEGAMIKYEKALKLLPKDHIDIPYLRSSMAACYMQMGIGEFPRAIKECDLALESFPKYSKALLKRARCYESLNKLDLAFKDVNSVLNIETNNIMALEIAQRVKKELEKKGLKVDGEAIVLAPEYVEPPPSSKVIKEKRKKKIDKDKEKKAEDQVVVEDTVCNSEEVKEEVTMRTIKLVFGEDIRCVHVPSNCSILQVRDIIQDRFPSLKAVLIKYKDQEGDLVTITSTVELRWAEASAEPQGSIRLYVVEVNPEHEPLLDRVEVNTLGRNKKSIVKNGNARNVGEMQTGSSHIDDWIIQFARLFKNHVGFNSDAYLDLHEMGMKFYSEAMEDTVTSKAAQNYFDTASEKFQEMAALALFNWGNVHMSTARKRVLIEENDSKENVLAQVKTAYEWAQKEYVKAGIRYKEALRIKSDFYEGHLALGQQQFEQAKLSWYYAIGTKVDLETWPSSEVLQLYNSAEDNMEKGFKMWEEMEEESLSKILESNKVNKTSKWGKVKVQLHKMGLEGPFKYISVEEASEHAANMRSQINLLWGTILYERSIVEFKLGIPVWDECLEAAVEKFELAGASQTDITIMLKSHCSIKTAVEGLDFKMDEIVQAWNEMYDAKRWQSGIPSFRLEPLFRRQVSKLHHILEHI